MIDKNKILTPRRAQAALVTMIREERIRHGFTAAELAEAADIAPSTYRKFEQQQVLQSAALMRVFAVLGLLERFADFLAIERKAGSLEEFKYDEEMAQRQRSWQKRS